LRAARVLLGIVVALIAVGASGCGSPALALVSARGYPLGDMKLSHGGHQRLALSVEIAGNRAAWEKGLMGVRELPADQGMAFVFPSQVSLGFWMKDTLIPLDIAFADAQGTVVDVQHMPPCTADPCPVYYSASPYSTALEARSGALTAAGIHAGDVMVLHRRAPTTASPGG
jgi:uncharacterized membrane protein (UPF0127 family)